MLQFTDQEILEDLKKTYNLKKEERNIDYKNLSSIQKQFAISQEFYTLAIEYYKQRKFLESVSFYELGQLHYSKYLKQTSSFKKRNS